MLYIIYMQFCTGANFHEVQAFVHFIAYPQKSTKFYRHHITARVHNTSIEGEYLTTYIPCTNALHQITPVNYRILSDLIYA